MEVTGERGIKKDLLIPHIPARAYKNRRHTLLQSKRVDGPVEMDTKKQALLVDDGAALWGVDDGVAEVGEEGFICVGEDWFLEDAWYRLSGEVGYCGLVKIKKDE